MSWAYNESFLHGQLSPNKACQAQTSSPSFFCLLGFWSDCVMSFHRGSLDCYRFGFEETETFYFHLLFFFSHHLELMATHSSVLAWRIPGTGEPDGLPSMGSYRVGHDWSDFAVAELLLGFPYGSAGKESTCSVGDLGLIPGLERSPGKGTATHSSIPAWRIPWTTVGSKRVGCNWATSLSLHRACLPSGSNISSAIPCVWDSRCLERMIQVSNEFL